MDASLLFNHDGKGTNEMKEKSKTVSKMDIGRRITLASNNALTNDPCVLCGGRCDPCGFDYFEKGTGKLVCDGCAYEYAPELMRIRTEAFEHAKRERDLFIDDIRDKILKAINEPVEDRVMRLLKYLKDSDVPF